MKNPLLVSLVVAAFLAACSVQHGGHASVDAQCDYVDTLDIGRAETDATTALAAHDKRALALYGYTFYFPGSYDLVKPTAYRPLECTGDNDSTGRPEHTEKAQEYARLYNGVIFREQLQTSSTAVAAAGEHMRNGWRYGGSKQSALAFAEFARASELVPLAPEPAVQSGLLHRELGQWDLALADYERALMLDPDNASYVLQRAHILLDKADTPRAFDELTQAIEHDPVAEFYWLRSQIFENRRMTDAALDDLRLAMDRDPSFWPPYEESCRLKFIHNRDLSKGQEECGMLSDLGL
jgi:tetratricopeptide (TPR) repeat protein